MAKKRLDVLMVEQGLAESRQKAQALIMAGQVFVGERRYDKAGISVDESVRLEVRGQALRYVSRGGLKLEKAMTCFPIRLDGCIAADIGASTGGTDAILEVVKDLPATTPGIVIVQHMPPVFTQMYAQRLDRICKMRVKEAAPGDRVVAGQIIIGAGGFHLRLARDARGYFVTSVAGPKVNGHCPSVDVLFDSVAETAGRKAIGVILTGMGADGAKGLLRMRKAGAYTIGQDKESSVVYGMPMVAYDIGAVEKQLPLNAIDNEILRQLSMYASAR